VSARVPSWYVPDTLARLAGELRAMSKPGARMPNGYPVGVGELRVWAQRWCLPLDTVQGLLRADREELPALSLEDADALLELVDGGIVGGYGDEGGWEFSDHADALRAKLRKHRVAAMERYEGSGS